MSTEYDARVAAALRASNAAAQAGDTDAANRHWEGFVYLLWKPMEGTVPWKKDDATPPRDSATASRSRESNTATTK